MNHMFDLPQENGLDEDPDPPFLADLPQFPERLYENGKPNLFNKTGTVCALYWLGKQLGLHESFPLADLINRLHFHGSKTYYSQKIKRQEKNGRVKNRILFIPDAELMAVQRKISSRLFESAALRHENSHGYLGSNCQNAIGTHWQAKSMLIFDVKDAFFKVNRERLFGELRNRGFGWQVASFICDLCLYFPVARNSWLRSKGARREFLPQGAPTSAKLFDLAFRELDKYYAKFARRHGGTYSRYADNIFIGLPREEFPERLANAALQEASRHGFPAHKVRKIRNAEFWRGLGLNMNAGQLTNSRAFRRAFRGALHHLEYVLDRGLARDGALQKINGFMSFAVNLPGDLRQDYETCLERIRNQSIKI